MYNVKLIGDFFTLEGFSAVRLTGSLSSLASRFELCTREDSSAPFNDDSLLKLETDNSPAVRLLVENAPFLTGYIDKVSYGYASDGRKEIIIEGRSKAGDLVDSSGNHILYKDRPLHEIIGDILSPFGISLTNEALDMNPMNFAVQTGESVAESLARLCFLTDTVLFSGAAGELVLSRRILARPAAVTLKSEGGSNILEARRTWNGAAPISSITCVGEEFRSGNENESLERSVLSSLLEKKGKSKRHRPVVLLADGGSGKTAAILGKNERRTSLRTSGWLDAAGTLFRPHTLAEVSDSWLRLSGLYLINEVCLYLSEKEGTYADLTLEEVGS